MNPNDWMDSMSDFACQHGGPCRLDHTCKQGRCTPLETRNGGAWVDTREERRIKLDSRLLRVVCVALLGFWAVVGWAVWERVNG